MNASILNETPLLQLDVTHDLTDYLCMLPSLFSILFLIIPVLFPGYITNVTSTDCSSGCQLSFSVVGKLRSNAIIKELSIQLDHRRIHASVH